MNEQAPELLLYGIFSKLVRSNVPLGIADFLEGIRALRLSSSPLAPAPGGGDLATRERVGRLCQILWARTPEEARLIDQVIASIPKVQPEDVANLERKLTELTDSSEAPPTVPPVPMTAPTGAEADATSVETSISVAFEPARGGTGLALPRLRPTRASSDIFVMEPQSVVSARTLSVLWRRFRRFERTGPKTEFDLHATIAERSRRGFVSQPVMRSPRMNRARLLILIDASESMVPWRPFVDAATHSLAASRLAAPAVFYFNNVPQEEVFRTSEQEEAAALPQVLQQNQGASLLIISDAGAARGALNHKRVRSTANFLAMAKGRMPSIVWLNPMPRARWLGNSAERCARSKNAVFLPLDLSSLILAVDVLRGVRAA